MMRSAKKGLDDSIWASRGRATKLYGSSSGNNNYYSSSSSYQSRPSRPTTSAITPATQQSPPLPPPPPSSSPPPSKNGAGTHTPDSESGNATSSAAAAAAGNQTKTTSNAGTTGGGGLSSQQEFRRYIQIVRRLKWKLPYLSHGYQHAIARPGDALYGGETDAEEAELMFKLDFYEYYMLLERALVHLLGVFGIVVSGDLRYGAAVRDGNGIGLGNGHVRGGAYRAQAHAYHENVIAALERTDNPLHEALGQGEVLYCLWRAKELRNRWKHAEDTSGGGRVRTTTTTKDERGRERAGMAPLESYDLDRIFRYVFAGFDAGYVIAQEKVAREVGGVRGEGPGGEEGSMEVEEDEFDFMVEAMDWEAV